MDGTNAATGKPLSGIAHLRQSVSDILCTRLGTRVMRRTYGSKVPDLVDAPMNGRTLLEIYAASAEALGRWEPRIRVKTVVAASAAPGEVVLDLSGTYLPDGREITLDGIVVN